LKDENTPTNTNNEIVNSLNKILPKIPTMRWGALTNISPTNAKIEEMNRLLPHDKKWHLLFEEKNQINVDGIPIRRKTLDSMT
jgi:hypothetical protein